MHISQQEWVKVPHEVRLELVQEFGLKRSGIIQVFNNTLMSDGYSYEDLAPLTVERMQLYVGTRETDYFKLWEATTNKANSLVKKRYEEEKQKQARIAAGVEETTESFGAEDESEGEVVPDAFRKRGKRGKGKDVV